MRFNLAPTLCVFTFSLTALGCSPGYVVAEAYEKVCKANCECSDAQDEWNDEKNCKKACKGDSKSLAALLDDRTNEPCDDVKDIARELEDCAKEGCGQARDECVAQAAADLYECWPDEGANGNGDSDEEELNHRDLEREAVEELLLQLSSDCQ